MQTLKHRIWTLIQRHNRTRCHFFYLSMHRFCLLWLIFCSGFYSNCDRGTFHCWIFLHLCIHMDHARNVQMRPRAVQRNCHVLCWPAKAEDDSDLDHVRHWLYHRARRFDGALEPWHGQTFQRLATSSRRHHEGVQSRPNVCCPNRSTKRLPTIAARRRTAAQRPITHILQWSSIIDISPSSQHNALLLILPNVLSKLS